jgi:hypothetical protein
MFLAAEPSTDMMQLIQGKLSAGFFWLIRCVCGYVQTCPDLFGLADEASLGAIPEAAGGE